jgi:glycosyltransferase involved in cell wall biosynthesis
MKREILLFVKKADSTFVIQDEKILNKHFSVKSIKYGVEPGLKTIYNQIRLLIWLLKNIWSAHFVYIWFADYHSFLPVLFAKALKRKSILVLGGYDVTYIPELKYGAFSNPLRAFCTKFSMRNATLCLPVCDNIEKEALERVPKAKTKIIYTGYSEDKFLPSKMGKQKIVLTVGAGNSLQRLKIKGIDFFIEIARAMPIYKFVVVGMSKNALKYLKNIPPNIEILEKMGQNKLIEYYQKAKVYTQFSIREGLPNVVCEAMLCECVPVGFNNGGIPIAIGDCGFILKERSVDKAIEMIEKAMNSPESLGKKARERIMNNFTLEQRGKKIILLMEKSDG